VTIEAKVSRIAGWSAKAGLFAALSLSLAACGGESLSDTLGYGKSAPDEFAIVTKAPLVIPPDYSLRPPRPGALRPPKMSAPRRARASWCCCRKPARRKPIRASVRS